jgi:AraC-like DNA-binding protein
MRPYPESYPEYKSGVWFGEEDNIVPVIDYLVYRECNPRWFLKKHPLERSELTYVIRGAARYTIDGVPYDLAAGDLLCLKEGVMKEALTYRENLMHCFSANFELRNLQNQAVFLPFPQFSRIGMLPDLVQQFHELIHTSLDRQPGYVLKCSGLLLLILHRIYELTVLDIDANVKDSRIQDIIRYIMRHYSKPLTVRHLAGKAKLNTAYFGALFKQETGDSVHQYIAKIRVRNAENILRAGGYRVSEVAEQCGYRDAYHFYKQFRAITGKPPSRYLHQKNQI